MMKFIEYFRKQRALKSYVKILPLFLKRRYGKHKRYTEGQVRKTLTDAGLNQQYSDYAFAMYLSRQEFEALTRKNEISCDYSEARQEIADIHFQGNSDFTIHDTLDAAKTSSGFFGDDSDFDGGVSNFDNHDADAD